MMQRIIQLLSGALGSIGFGLLFHLNRRYLPAAGVGGLLAWLAYLLAAPAVHGTFLANLMGGVCAALYAEVLARCRNAPLYPVFHHRGHPPHPRQHPILLHERRRLQRPARRRAFWGADLSGGAGHCGRHGHRMVSGRFKPEAPGAAVKRVLRRAPAA